MIDTQDHQRLLKSLLTRYKWAIGQSLSYEDLLQEGNIAMLAAARDYDPARGAFSSLAVRHVRNHMTEYVAKTVGAIRVPRRAQTRKWRAGLEARPSIGAALSEDDFITDRPDTQAETADALDRARACRATRVALATLTAREQTMVRGYFYEGLEFRTIGERLGRSGERVRQIVNVALDKMRAQLGEVEL